MKLEAAKPGLPVRVVKSHYGDYVGREGVVRDVETRSTHSLKIDVRLDNHCYWFAPSELEPV